MIEEITTGDNFPLRFHNAAFRILGVNPCIEPSVVDAIERKEKEIGARLPASVREFFIHGGGKLRLGYGNYWRVADLDCFLEEFTVPDWAIDEKQGIRIDELLCNCDAQVEFAPDGTNDPLVFDDITGCIRPMPFSALIYDLACQKADPDSLLTGLYLFTCAWSTSDAPMAFGLLNRDFLQENFDALNGRGTFEYWSPRRSYRPSRERLACDFFRSPWRVQVESDVEPSLAGLRTTFRLFADSDEELLKLYSFLWPNGSGPVFAPRIAGLTGIRPSLLATEFRKQFPTVSILDDVNDSEAKLWASEAERYLMSKSVSSLLVMLEDRRSRGNALSALERKGKAAVAAVPQLVERLENADHFNFDQFDCLDILSVLKSIGPDALAAIPVLTRMINDDDLLLRGRIRTSLRAIAPHLDLVTIIEQGQSIPAPTIVLDAIAPDGDGDQQSTEDRREEH